MEKMDFTVELPEFQPEIYTITDYGAVSGGITVNSEAIQDAIDWACAHGGGHVVIPRGLWLTGPIEIKSGVDLHLAEGAVLLFDKSEKEYPLKIADYEGVRRIRTISPIFAQNAENIGMTGAGIIDGNGQLWRVAKEFKFTAREWEKKRALSPNTLAETEEGQIWYPTRTAWEGFLHGEPEMEDEEAALKEAAPFYDYYRPVMVEFDHCSRILIEGVTLQNSPAWNLHPLFCTHLTVRNAWIRNNASAQNGDGLDLESSRLVEIHHVKFDVGDDAICMKSGKNAKAREIEGPTECVYIHDCTVYRGHGGFTVGSEMSRGIRHILVERCSFIGTDIGIRFKTALGRGGIVEDITIRDISMLRIAGEAIVFTAGYVLRTVRKSGLCCEEMGNQEETRNQEDVPEIRRISISNVYGTDIEWGIKIQGLPQMPIHDICISDVMLAVKHEYLVEYGEAIRLQRVVFTSNAWQQ